MRIFNRARVFFKQNEYIQALVNPSPSTGKILKREFTADGIQIPLKALATYSSGSHALLSELMRSFIDLVNHIILLFADTISKRPPSITYNYGER
jgi:divalent metal cation (Fe/Co/Zn/Cd) transporter